MRVASFGPQALAVRKHECLACAIQQHVRQRLECRHRGDIDQPAVLAREHGGHEGMRQIDQRRTVQRDHALRMRRIFAGERGGTAETRSEEHTSELQSLMRISYAAFCLKKKKYNKDVCLYKH